MRSSSCSAMWFEGLGQTPQFVRAGHRQPPAQVAPGKAAGAPLQVFQGAADAGR